MIQIHDISKLSSTHQNFYRKTYDYLFRKNIKKSEISDILNDLFIMMQDAEARNENFQDSIEDINAYYEALLEPLPKISLIKRHILLIIRAIGLTMFTASLFDLLFKISPTKTFMINPTYILLTLSFYLSNYLEYRYTEPNMKRKILLWIIPLCFVIVFALLLDYLPTFSYNTDITSIWGVILGLTLFISSDLFQN